MSPVPPPPAGTFIPSEDWSNDESFDFDSDQLPQSPSRVAPPSSSPGHRPRLSGVMSSSSPLRQSYAQTSRSHDNEDDDDFDFNDLPADGTDSFPAFPTTAPSATGTIRNLNLSKTVVGSGPNGVGTITKFVPKSNPGVLSKGSIRMKDKAVAKAWEEDLDLDDLGFEDEGDWKDKLASKRTASAVAPFPSPNRPLTLRPTTGRAVEMPGADALDGFDDLEEEDREATLKASATLKARLPPPRPKSTTTANNTTPPSVNTEVLDLGDDADFDLPLNLTNLNLASRSSSSSQRQKTSAGPRSSMASSDWDSGGAKTDWWSENGTPSKRLSETSGTSISDGLNSAKGKEKDAALPGLRTAPVVRDAGEEEEDMEEGLVMPSKLFFATTSKRELDGLLDRKRKPQFAPSSHADAGDMTIRGGPGLRVEEGMEDGLVFEDQGRELTMNRLTMGKKARSKSHIPIPVSMKRPTSATATPARSSGTARHPSHDILGRTGLPSLRERTQSLAGHGHGHGLRSHSAGNVPTLSHGSYSSARPIETPPPSRFGLEASPSKGAEHYRSRSGHIPGPAAVPSTPSRGLRHQKSHHLLTSPSPAKPSASLSKKQSLSSLTQAVGGGSTLHTLAEDSESTPHKYHHGSTSRLTMPTSSSKAKARPPISSVFPMTHPHTPSSSSSSPPSQPPLSTRSKIRQGRAVGSGMRVKRRDWGDGTELEGIEDLEVEVDEKEKKSSWSKARARLVKEKKSHTALSPDKRTKTTSGTRDKDTGTGKEGGGSWGRKKKRPPLLIKHLGSVDQRKVVGDMTWNPVKLRWEGNETALRDFDNISISTSARPALITHISNPASPSTSHLPLDAVGTANTGGSRIVGDMRFDPKEMRWISLSPDEEPDPFEGMADDEDEVGGGGTIRARKFVTVGLSEASESLWSTSRKASEAVSAVSVLGSSAGESSSTGTSTSASISGNEVLVGHGVDASLVTDELRAECASAEERHKKDMRGWISNGGIWSRTEARREEKRLWDIRHLALKS